MPYSKTNRHKNNPIATLSALLLLVFASTSGFAAPETEPLPALGASRDGLTVSGISSGAYMATQFHVAFSDTVQGAGIVAGGPYHCAAQDPSMGILPQIYTQFWTAFYPQVYVNLMVASVYCFNAVQLPDVYGLPYVKDLSIYPLAPNADLLVEEARAMAKSGKIGALENLADDRVYLYTGQNDGVVPSRIVAATRDFYLKAGVKIENVEYVATQPAGHAYIVEKNYCDASPGGDQTERCANPKCESEKMPFINDCHYDQAQAILNHLYGPGLQPPSAGSTDVPGAKPFSQKGYFSSSSDFNDSLMADTGYVYVPEQCEGVSRSCRIHVAFHGCEQGAENYEKKGFGKNMFFDHVGYNEMARANDLIILYPQVNVGEGNFLKTKGYNPKGCWDWWGYTDQNFETKKGLQMAAVMKMVKGLTSNAR